MSNLSWDTSVSSSNVNRHLALHGNNIFGCAGTQSLKSSAAVNLLLCNCIVFLLPTTLGNTQGHSRRGETSHWLVVLYCSASWSEDVSCICAAAPEASNCYINLCHLNLVCVWGGGGGGGGLGDVSLFFALMTAVRLAGCLRFQFEDFALN